MSLQQQYQAPPSSVEKSPDPASVSRSPRQAHVADSTVVGTDAVAAKPKRVKRVPDAGKWALLKGSRGHNKAYQQFLLTESRGWFALDQRCDDEMHDFGSSFLTLLFASTSERQRFMGVVP